MRAERDTLLLEKEVSVQRSTEELLSRVTSVSQERDELQEALEALRQEKQQLRAELEDRMEMVFQSHLRQPEFPLREPPEGDLNSSIQSDVSSETDQIVPSLCVSDAV